MLEVRQVSKSFNGTPALREVSFRVAEGEILCLLGPSGCGKTTLLRVVAGLEAADQGQVLVAGADLSRLPVHRRGLGMMFQEYALFPHKDVGGNVAFGLRMAGLPQDEIEARVSEALGLVGLSGFEARSVHELSGGEQQRVALARSLAPRPRLLLLDEPLGSLDRALRERLMNELRHILNSVGVTSVYVTHDQSEAFALGDRVAIMHRGRIEQIGPPEAVYRAPASPFVARFLGMENLLPGEVVEVGAERIEVETRVGRFGIREPGTGIRNSGARSREPGDQVMVLLRPEAARRPKAARLSEEGEAATNSLRGRVVERSFRGGYYRLLLRHETGVELAFELDGEVPPVGTGVSLALRPEAINLLNPEKEEEV